MGAEVAFDHHLGPPTTTSTDEAAGRLDMKKSSCEGLANTLLGGGPVATPLYQAKAELFRILGHPARIRVLELLAERDHAVHELLEAIEIEPSNLSQQLAVIRRAGLVSQRREGGEVVYAISVPEVAELLAAGRRVLGTIIADRNELNAELMPKTQRRR